MQTSLWNAKLKIRFRASWEGIREYPGLGAYTHHLSSGMADSGGSCVLDQPGPATWWDPGQPKLHSKTLSLKDTKLYKEEESKYVKPLTDSDEAWRCASFTTFFSGRQEQ